MIFFTKRFHSLKSSKPKNIAIVMPTKNGVIEQIRTGFVSTLTTYDVPLEHDLIFGNGDTENLANHVCSALKKESYDLILSIGKSSTQVAKSVTVSNRSYIPIVFNAVIDPVGAGLVQSETYSGNHLTGFSCSKRDYTHQMKILLAIHPAIKNAVVLYSSVEINYTKEEIENMLNFLKMNGVKTTEIMWTNQHNLNENLSQNLASHAADVVITLRDQELIPHIGEVIEVCKKFNVPLYASDFESVKKGATFGYSDYDYSIGVETAQKALPILLQSKTPKEIAVSLMPWRGKLMFNSKTSIISNYQLDAINRFGSPEEIILI